jgi:DNA-binding ferritin-like protein
MTTKNYRSKKNKPQKNKTQKNKLSRSSSSLSAFQKEITVVFLEILMMVKLYHWKTTSYATHKATDELYTKLNENIDSFIEVLLGKTGSRIDLMSHKQIKLIDLSSSESLKREIEGFKGYLVSLNENRAMQTMSNTDLFNIRDEILGNLNQFLYLLTFK